MKRALLLGALAACGSAPTPTSKPAPKPIRPVVHAKEVLPATYPDDEYGASGDWADAEASVTCEEPEGSFAIAAMPPPPPDELETRGWASVGRIVFREGCVSPSHLEISLRDGEPALLDCFAAQTSDWVTVIARIEIRRDGLGSVATRQLTSDWSEERMGPDLDLGRLDACFEQAFASLYLSGSAVIDVEIERGLPGEGGVMMGP